MIKPERVIKEYTKAGYACMAWSFHQSPCKPCSCGRKGFWYSLLTRHIFIMFREKWQPWKNVVVCGKCVDGHLVSLTKESE